MTDDRSWEDKLESFRGGGVFFIADPSDWTEMACAFVPSEASILHVHPRTHEGQDGRAIYLSDKEDAAKFGNLEAAT